MKNTFFFPYLQLMRPANIVTAMADILAGYALALWASFGAWEDIQWPTLGLLWLSTIGLYGGGVVMNDVFDADLDRKERPERPIPSGRASEGGAALLGVGLLAIGIAAAWLVSTVSGGIALLVAGLALLYDVWGKHQYWLGPLNMGACRGGNLLLGMSAAAAALAFWPIALVPVAYIAAITAISRGEVHADHLGALKLGAVLYALILATLAGLAFLLGENGWWSMPFLAMFAYFIYPPLLKAMKEKKAPLIGKAVKAGVIALIIMDACLAAAFVGWPLALTTICLLPISIGLAKLFAVT